MGILEAKWTLLNLGCDKRNLGFLALGGASRDHGRMVRQSTVPQTTHADDLAEIKREVEQVEALVVQLRLALDSAIERLLASKNTDGSP